MCRSPLVRRSFLLLLVLLATGADLRAQEGPYLLRVGDLARLRAPEAPDGRVVGRVRMIDADSVVLHTSGPLERVVLPLPSITVAEFANGKNRGKGALIGAGLGTIGGVVLAIACNAVCTSESNDASMSLVLAAYVSPFVGAGLGATFAPPRWAELPLLRRGP